MNADYNIDTTLLSAVGIGSWLITGIIYYLSRSGWLLDIPNDRSAHVKPTASGGGLAIVISFYLAMIAGLYCEQSHTNFFWALVGGILVAGIGFWDDHRHIPARWRLLGHSIAAAWASYHLGFQGLEYLLALIILVWCLNLFNFMDGIDGLAATEAIFFALAFVLLIPVYYPPISISAMILAVAVLGFLLWNLPPAKIFMGDVGSGFLGFMLGILILNQGLFSTGFYTGLILFSVFICDATLTLLIRMYRGEQWYQAHCCHAYQHSARKRGHCKTTAIFLLINLVWVLPMALLALRLPEFAPLLLILTYTPLLILAWRCGAGIIDYS